MILTCPECATSYFVDEAKIPSEGRTVRCASCGHRWTAVPEAAPEPAPDPEQGAIDHGPPLTIESMPVSELPGEALPKVFRAKADTNRRVREAAATGIVWAAMAAGVVVLIALAIVFRVDVVKLWPKSAAAYASVGLPVNSLGLAIEGVRYEPSLQEGHAALSVSGMIRNIEDHTINAPPLSIRLLNAGGDPVAAKIARAADPRIPPGETRHFAIVLMDPPKTARVLEVAFDDKAPATAGASEAHHGEAPAKSVDLRGAAEAEAPAAEHGPAPVEAQPLPESSPDALTPHDGHG